MVATLTQTTVSPTLTVASVQAGFQTAMTNAGFSHYSVYSTYYQTFYYQYNSGVTKGTAYLNMQINSNIQFYPLLYDSWNSGTNTGTNPSYATSNSYYLNSNNTVQVVFTAINHPEFRGVLMQSGTNYSLFGVFVPANIPTWWNQTNYLYAFMPHMNGSNFSWGWGSLLPCSSNPFNTTNGNNALSVVSSNVFENPNPNNSYNYDVVTGILLAQPTGAGYVAGGAGTTSTDLAFGSAYGKNCLDVWSIGSQQYTIINNPQSMAGLGYGIRTA